MVCTQRNSPQIAEFGSFSFSYLPLVFSSPSVLLSLRPPSCSEQRQLLVKCAATALSSKLVASQKDFFSEMVVDAVSLLDDLLPLNMIGVKKVQGGSLEVRDKEVVFLPIGEGESCTDLALSMLH